MTLNAIQREQFFKPYRLQILKIRQGAHYSHYTTYSVLIRNITLTGRDSIVRIWEIHGHDRDHAGEWCDLTKDDHDLHSAKRRFSALKDAEAVAVREAEVLQLLFHHGKDILPEDEIVRGPVQKCLTCGRDTERGFAPVVCESCRAALQTGRQAFGERKPYAVQYFDLLEYLFGSGTDDLSKALIELILKLIGTQFAGAFSPGDPDGPPVATLVSAERQRGMGARGWTQKVFLTPEQFADIQALLAQVNAMGHAAHRAGRERGESILFQLAENELSVDDFNTMSIHHSRFAHRRAREEKES